MCSKQKITTKKNPEHVKQTLHFPPQVRSRTSRQNKWKWEETTKAYNIKARKDWSGYKSYAWNNIKTLKILIFVNCDFSSQFFCKNFASETRLVLNTTRKPLLLNALNQKNEIMKSARGHSVSRSRHSKREHKNPKKKTNIRSAAQFQPNC